MIPSKLTTIEEKVFYRCSNLVEIEVPTNSELRTIKQYAFSDSQIETLNFPANLVNLEKYWNSGLTNLINIIVDPRNPRFCSLDNKMLLGKSSLEIDDYDTLVIAYRYIKNVVIPSFIKHIGPYAFEECENIDKFEIPEDSELLTIGEGAFCGSSISYLKIPPSLTMIDEAAFERCGLYELEIPPNSNLQTIKQFAFADSYIQSLTIPAKLVEPVNFWFSNVIYLVTIKVDPINPRYKEHGDFIIGKSSINNDDFDSIIFYNRNVSNVEIPNFIRVIDIHAFQYCCVSEVKFEENSKLEQIKNEAFTESLIKSITIPSSVKIIHEAAFYLCRDLRRFDFQENSKLEEIKFEAFFQSAIVSFIIPASVKIIDCNSFSQCNELVIVEFEETENQLDIYNPFKGSSHALIMIPVKLLYLLDLLTYKNFR